MKNVRALRRRRDAVGIEKAGVSTAAIMAVWWRTESEVSGGSGEGGDLRGGGVPLMLQLLDGATRRSRD